MVTLQIIKEVVAAAPPADGALSKEETGNTSEEKEAVAIEEKKQIEPKAVEVVAQIKINGSQKERKCK